jgi:diaminopimelate decarboxylase
MDHVAGLLARYFGVSGRHVELGGIPAHALVERYGSPLFVYDRDVLDRKWAGLREALPSGFTVYYSVKANPNVHILRHFLALGSGLEVASGGEIHRALQAGCAPRRILFAGPGKTEAELELALTRGIGEIHVESALEASRVCGLARRLGTTARVAIRVNPGMESQGGAMRMGGKPAPFGIDEEALDPVIDLILNEPVMDLRGLHIFAGTQILDHAVLLQQYRAGVALARRVGERIGRPLQTLDFGGGLGVPYFPAERELDLGKFSEELRGLMAEVEGDPVLSRTEFIVEPGRYLVAESGVYVTRITDIKRSRGKTFLVTDGGMNHHLSASGNLGQVIKRNFPVAILDRIDQPSGEVVDVVGPLCTPLDTLAREIRLPSAEVGDLIGIFQSGAYGLTASPTAFLSHRSPAEILVARGSATVIRPRSNWSEIGAAEQ